MTNNQTVMEVDAEDQDSLDQRSVLLIRESSIESLVCSAKNMMGSTTCILQAHQMQGKVSLFSVINNDQHHQNSPLSMTCL
jgi:hypothetical protein